MTAYVDTNVLVRHLTGDHTALSPRATAMLGRHEALVLTPSVLLETAHVLRARYGCPRDAVVALLRGVVALPAIVCEDPVIPTALDLHDRRGIDLPDAVLAAHALLVGPPRVASFDADLDRVPGLVRVAS